MRVLLVEDNPILREALLAVLDALGGSVTVAAGVDDALRELDTGVPFDALVSDIDLGSQGGTGFDIAHHCIEEALVSSVVLLSGHPVEHYAAELAELPSAQYVRKPVTVDQFMTALGFEGP